MLLEAAVCIYSVSYKYSGASSAQYQRAEILRPDSGLYGYTGATEKHQFKTVAFKFNTLCSDSHQDQNLAGDFKCVLRNKGAWPPQLNLSFSWRLHINFWNCYLGLIPRQMNSLLNEERLDYHAS